MKQSLITMLLICSISISGCTQSLENKNGVNVGGGCEGCEAIFESPVPFEKIPSVVYLPGYDEPGPKMMISGKNYKKDGRTPAPGVILYIYHTDQTGKYRQTGNETGWGKRHGYMRGWVKSDNNGRYTFYTLKPASYPGRQDPAHIHPTIKEPGYNEYWIDEYLFDDDPKLNDEQRKRQERGGNGIIKLKMENGILTGSRDIVLGLNVPGYK